MPKEDRRLIFKNEEVYQAVYALCKQKEMPVLPPGHIVSVVEKRRGLMEIRMINPAENQEEKLEYTSDFMAAALMLFCKGSGIPLPKTASKSIMLKDGRVILRVQVEK